MPNCEKRVGSSLTHAFLEVFSTNNHHREQSFAGIHFHFEDDPVQSDDGAGINRANMDLV
jgi:hypothetical protein